MFGLLVGVLAVVLRTCNLGSFSLWWDEVFTMRAASLPLLETLATCARDAENVPFYAVVTNLTLKTGLQDPWIRLVPIAAGLSSIALLAVWTRRHFGPTTAGLTAAFCALSPFHVRYSQELRAYPYLLLMSTATLVLADRLRARSSTASMLSLAGIVGLGFYTNLTYALTLVPVSILFLSQTAAGKERRTPDLRARRGYMVSLGLGGLLFLPWVWMIWPALMHRLPRARYNEWNLQAIGQRWECLTVGPGLEDQLTWFGLIVAAMAIVGMACAARTPSGRAAILPVLPVLIVWEALLVVISHWSVPRYNTALWPFLAVLVALGFERFLHVLGWRWARWLACLAVAVPLLARVDAYHRLGRPHWDTMAEVVNEVRRPKERVFTLNRAGAAGLSYYLDETVSKLDKTPDRLPRKFSTKRSLLVFSAEPLAPEILERAVASDVVTRIHLTGVLTRLRFAPRSGDNGMTRGERPTSWPLPLAELIPGHFEELPRGCISGWFRGSNTPVPERLTHIDFDASDRDLLRSGWSPTGLRSDGASRVWALGAEASLALGALPAGVRRVEIRLRSHPDLAGSLWVRAIVNEHVLGEKPVPAEEAVIVFDAPAHLWHESRNLVVLQFLPERRNEAGRRERTAEFDWIRLTAPE